MCLLIFWSRVDDHLPLVVGANRDERYDRAAKSAVVLRDKDPRILGGRDLLAGGTWLALNDHGVVAGLTNTPTVAGRQSDKRSRGELPIALATHRSASSAVVDFAQRFRPASYNPCWILVGDRESLYSIDMAAGDEPQIRELGPGRYVIENGPLGESSPKVDHVEALLAKVAVPFGSDWEQQLATVLGDHEIPNALAHRSGTQLLERRRALSAACVHTDGYGTRSSCIIGVPSSPKKRPSYLVADGPPDRTPFFDAAPLWDNDTLVDPHHPR